LQILKNRIFELQLFCGQQYDVVRNMPLSYSNELYESKPFEDWKASRENDQKLSIAIIERLDGLAKQVNELAKTIAKRG